MPQIRRLRTWCKSCQDWTVHSIETCMTCESIFESYKLSEIPEDKIQEQRERYKASKKRQFVKLLAYDFSQSNYVLTESDAGQDAIDIANKIQRQKIQDKLSEIKAEHETYSKLGRNEKCSCGSGKKYKQCHLIYFRQYLNV